MNIIISNSKGGCGKSTLVLAIADVLSFFNKRVKIIDLDNQGTLSLNAVFCARTKKFLEEKNPTHILCDLPPYHTPKTRELYKTADIVIVPCLVGLSDLLSLNQTLSELSNCRYIVVFNKIRKPLNNSYYKVKEYFKSNFEGLCVAKTELTNLLDYLNIYEFPLPKKKAFKEVLTLLKELNLIKTV